jgi:glutathione synthase/RimK-type ligase-like ATP-grasp enzyme
VAHVQIISFPSDVHALAVEWGLSELGHTSSTWCISDLPQRQHVTATFSGNDPRASIRIVGPGPVSLDVTADAYWHRRNPRPVFPSNMVAADRVVAEREFDALVSSIFLLRKAEGFWVNPPDQPIRAGRKPVQLSAARSAGLRTPETIITNSYEEVLAFLERFNDQVIFKPLHQATWIDPEGGSHVLLATRITRSQLTEQESVSLCPGIYQPYIDKAFELRVHVFGETCITAKLLSQAHPSTVTDWRMGSGSPHLKAEPYELPERVEKQCIEVVRRLGGVFGCLDLIVTPEGEYVFLEVNGQGQWLWVEELVPKLPLLDCFCHFIAAGRPEFRWQEGMRSPVSYRRYLESGHFERFQAERLPAHVEYLSRPHVVKE